MSLTSYELFNIWFPAIAVALAIAALWDFVRRRFWLFCSGFCPGVLREVGLDSRYQSRAEAEDHHREITEKLNVFARVMNLLVSPTPSNFGAATTFDVEAQIEINPHHAAPVIRMNGTSAAEGTYTISSSSENHVYPRKTIQGVDCRPITIIYTAYFPDGTPKDVTRPAKRLFKSHANGPVKRIKSSIILQASIAIDPWVLAEIVELAKHCIQKENRCIFQLGNWAILYHNAGKVQMHLLKEGDVPVNVEARWQDGKTGITMRGLYLTGSQVKLGTKRSSKILRSAGPATQEAGDLDELLLPTGEFDVPGKDSLIYASKVVVVDGVSLIVRSEASFILPLREENTLIESVWTRCLRISNSAKKMLLSLLFEAEDCLPERCQLERAANHPKLKIGLEQLELSVEHWKGLSEIELLNTRKEVLLFLQEQRASGIIGRAGPPSPHSHFIFIRDEHYSECWQEGLRVLNEAIHRNSNDSHSHTQIGTQIRVRGGIQFLLGDFESALQDYDLAHLIAGGNQSTVLLERALVKCKLGRYSEAMQDVVAVITLNPNVNDIQELQACIQQILDQQRPFRIVTESGPSCQRPLLPPDQEKAMVEIPDFLTGDEWHSGEIGSLRPISDAGTARGSASDPPSKQSVDVARTADWSMTSIAEALRLQLMLTNYAQSLGINPRYHVRRISCIVNILKDECDPYDVVKPLSMEDQEMLNWQAPAEDLQDLQDDLRVRDDLSSLSGRLCPYKNISLSLYDKVTADDGHEQRREPLPPFGYRHVSFRSAMLTNHSAADRYVQTLLLYDGTPRDRSLWRWGSHDYVKELVHPGARSPYRAFWIVQWDVVDMWHVVQGDPDRGLCLNAAAVECQDGGGKFHSIGWVAEVTAAGACSPTSDSNDLNRHCGRDARTNPRMGILVNEKPQTSLQTQPLRASGVDSVFPTISENFTSGGDSTVDSSSMNAYEWKSGDNFHYHNRDEEAVSEVLRSAETHRISEEWNRKDETQGLKIENGLQVAMKRGSYHDLSRSTIEQESAVLENLKHPNFFGGMKLSISSLRKEELMEDEELVEDAELMEDVLSSVIDSLLKVFPEGSTPSSWPETCDFMLQIAAAMASLHGHNGAHRDLEYQNILYAPLHTLREPGLFRPDHYLSVKVADFGLAKSRLQCSDWVPTRIGTSLQYKAPELFELREIQISQKADVYRFGVACCVILTGESPYADYRHQGLSLHDGRPLDNRLLRDVPEALKKLIHQCLDSNPALRPTFDHIVMKLRECKVQAHEDSVRIK